MKKLPSKVAHNQRQTFVFQYLPGCLNGPKTEIPYHQKPLNAGLGIQTGIHTIFSQQHKKLIPTSLVSVNKGTWTALQYMPQPTRCQYLPLLSKIDNRRGNSSFYFHLSIFYLQWQFKKTNKNYVPARTNVQDILDIYKSQHRVNDVNYKCLLNLGTGCSQVIFRHYRV